MTEEQRKKRQYIKDYLAHTPVQDDKSKVTEMIKNAWIFVKVEKDKTYEEGKRIFE